MKIALRILKEFWLPCVIAMLWTAYNIHSETTSWGLKQLLNIFGPTFFLVSWATGQFFRIQKQAHIEKNLDSIEGRLEKSVAHLEKIASDLHGYATGADSFVSFLAFKVANDVLELAVFNNSAYPVFDIYSELIDLDEKIDPEHGKLWTRNGQFLGTLYPNKIHKTAYLINIAQREHLKLNIFINTRNAYIIQSLRIVMLADRFIIANRVMVSGKTVISEVPGDFPGIDVNDPDAVFR